MKKLQIVLTAVAILLALPGLAQKNYSKGYVITNQSDTLHGVIKDSGLFTGNTSIRFIDEAGVKHKFTARDIAGYSKGDIIEYQSLSIGWDTKFAEVVEDGPVRLLRTYEEDWGGIITDDYDDDIEKVYYLVNKENSITTKVSMFNFKKRMSSYFSDHAELEAMILNKELRYRDIRVIVGTYNRDKEV